MKYLKIYFAILLAGALTGALSGCTKFLEEHPATSLSAEEIYSDDNGAVSALNGLYASLATQNYYGQKIQVVLETFSGVYSTGETTNADFKQAAALNMSTNHTDNGLLYQSMFRMINNTNDVLEHIESAYAKGDISAAAYRRIKGEASFLRAFVYFDAVRCYGKVPLRTSFSDGKLPRARIIDIYSLILSDLDVAEDNMLSPEELAAQDLVGTPSMWAAVALRAKVYVAMACIAENPGEPFDADGFSSDSVNDYWIPAYMNAKRVYDSGEFMLVPSLKTLWLDFAGRRNNAESIFEIQHSIASLTCTCNYWSHYIPAYYGGDSPDGVTGFVGCALLNANNNASRILVLRETYDRHAVAYPSDPRLKITYIASSFYRNKNYPITDNVTGVTAVAKAPPYAHVTNAYPDVPPVPNATNRNRVLDYPHCKKFTDPTTQNTSGSVNWPAIRFADIILTLAEAANEIDCPESEILGYVDEVLSRARTGDPDSPASVQPKLWPTGLSKDQLRERIMNERLFELHGELTEFYDVRRRGLERFKTQIVINHNNKLRDPMWSNYDPATGQYILLNQRDYFWNEDNYSVKKAMLLPIPADEINNNPNMIKNNFGY